MHQSAYLGLKLALHPFLHHLLDCHSRKARHPAKCCCRSSTLRTLYHQILQANVEQQELSYSVWCLCVDVRYNDCTFSNTEQLIKSIWIHSCRDFNLGRLLSVSRYHWSADGWMVSRSYSTLPYDSNYDQYHLCDSLVNNFDNSSFQQ